MDNSGTAVFSEVTPLAQANRQGVASSSGDLAGITLEILETLAIVQVFAAKGKASQVATSLALPTGPGTAVIGDAYTAIPLAPAQWMLHSNEGRDGSLCENLRSQLDNDGYVSEQSHGRLIIRVSGANARQLMQKGCRLDLHPSVARGGFCAQTNIAQTGVIVHQRDENPTYDLMLYSGFARSFWHWLTESAAEYGFEVVGSN